MTKQPEPSSLIPMGASPRNRWGVSPSQVNMVRARSEPRPLEIAAEPQNIVVDFGKQICGQGQRLGGVKGGRN